jgi:hypothetical protein
MYREREVCMCMQMYKYTYIYVQISHHHVPYSESKLTTMLRYICMYTYIYI